MNISIIVAVAENWVIGENNQLLWHISQDLKRFKALTSGHSIIMGRKTFESIGRPLPNRKNIVVSRNTNLAIDGCIIVNSLNEALEITKGETEVFVVGGGELYRQALPLANKLYLTKVHKNFEGDTIFPTINFDEWKLMHKQDGDPTVNGLQYSFCDYIRIE